MHEKRTIKKLHVQMVFLMMNTWCPKHVEDDKNWIKTLIWKVYISLVNITSLYHNAWYTKHKVHSVVMLSLLATHPVDCTVVHKCLPVGFLIQICSCAIYTATAAQLPRFSCTCLTLLSLFEFYHLLVLSKTVLSVHLSKQQSRLCCPS